MSELEEALILIQKLLDEIDYIQCTYDRGWGAEETVKEAEEFLQQAS